MRHTGLLIAARNVLRNKRRTAVTAIVLTVGISAFIAFDSMLAGMDRMTIESMMRYTTSALVARTPEWEKNASVTPLEHGIRDPKATARAMMAASEDIRAATSRTRFVATASNYTDEQPLIATAIDPAKDSSVFDLAGAVTEGTWLNPDSPGIVVGSNLAKDLGLKVGDYLLLSATTTDGNLNADEYPIEGLLTTSSPEIDNTGLYIPYPLARRLLGENLPVTEIAMAVKNQGTLDSLLARARVAGEKAAIAAKAATAPAPAPAPAEAEAADADAATDTSTATTPGQELILSPVGVLAGDYLAMRNMKSKYSFSIILVVLAIAAVGIVNTVLMSVYARIKEIGVLLAYGMPRREIGRMFATEGLIVGVIGSLGGVASGALIVWFMVAIGIDLTPMMGKLDMGSIPAAGILHGEWKIGSMVFGFGFGVAASWLAALIPSRKASRMRAVDALRFV